MSVKTLTKVPLIKHRRQPRNGPSLLKKKSKKFKRKSAKNSYETKLWFKRQPKNSKRFEWKICLKLTITSSRSRASSRNPTRSREIKHRSYNWSYRNTSLSSSSLTDKCNHFCSKLRSSSKPSFKQNLLFSSRPPGNSTSKIRFKQSKLRRILRLVN